MITTLWNRHHYCYSMILLLTEIQTLLCLKWHLELCILTRVPLRWPPLISSDGNPGIFPGLHDTLLSVLVSNRAQSPAAPPVCLTKNTGIYSYLDLFKASIHPVQQLAEGFEGQSLHSLQAGIDDHLLPSAPIQTETLGRESSNQHCELCSGFRPVSLPHRVTLPSASWFAKGVRFYRRKCVGTEAGLDRRILKTLF